MLETILEKPDYILINKPAGLVVHSDGKTNEPTLCDWILKKYPEISGVGEPLQLNDGTKIDRPGIVHRLDRETSGIMIIARTQKGFEHFKKLFQERAIEKTYHLFVYGNIIEDEGVINEPIGRSKKDFRRWLAGINARGELREAVTEFKVLKRANDKSVTFVEAHPKTGRTHQIRVHFTYIHRPLIADKLYAPGREPVLGFERTALHSYKIEFTDQNSEKIIMEAPYPDDFQNAIKSI